MNKRFSTLMATALVAGGLSSTAMGQSTNAFHFEDVKAATVSVEKAAEGNYYHLGSTDNYLSFRTDDKKVYLETRSIASSTTDPSVYVTSTDSALWEPTIVITNNVKSFKFTNKLTGAVLAVKYNKDKTAAELVSETTEGAISSFTFEGADGSKNLVCYDADKVKYVLNISSTAGNKAEFVKWKSGESYTVVNLLTPAQKIMTAEELNAIGNGSFKLNILDQVTDGSADYINASTLTAYPALIDGASVVDKGVYLRVNGAKKAYGSADKKQVDKNGKELQNKNVFLVVDTVFNTGTAFNDSIGGRGLKISADSVVCKWASSTADITSSKVWDFEEAATTILETTGTTAGSINMADKVAAGRAAANYRFYIYKNVSKAGGDVLTVKVDSIPTIGELKAGKAYSGLEKFPTDKDSIGYFAIARTGTGNPGLFTIVDSTSLAKAVADTYANVSFAQGKLATLEDGIYSIQKKGGKFAEAILVDMNVAGTKVKCDYTASVASELVPATQFTIKGRSGYYKIANRENGLNPFADAAKSYIYATDKDGEYKVSGSDDIYLIKKMNVKADDVKVGYLSFTDDQVANYAVKLKFNTTFGGDNLYVVGDSKLSIADADAQDAVEFNVRTAVTGVSGSDKKYDAKAYGNQELKRNAYYLTLAGNENVVFAYDRTAKTFGMRELVDFDKTTKKPDAYKDKPEFWKSNKDSIAVAVLFRATATEKQYQLIPADTTLLGSNFSYYKVDSTYMGQINVAGSGSAIIVTDFTSAPMGYFTVELPDDAAFVNVSDEPANKRIASAANPTLAISMDSQLRGVLKAETELKATDAFTKENFSMYLDTASMKNEEKPEFYIATAQTGKLTEEEIANDELFYMSSKDGSTVNFIKAKQYGQDLDSLVVYGAKNDTLKFADNYSRFAFAVTSTKGEYKIQHTKSGKYLAQENGVLTLAGISPYSGLSFTLEAAESPVGNEGISASEVSIVAGDGKIVIKGAQGKIVAISNILGQTIANTVISSDNAEIAVPQGVVVVAVEGEAAVKAIVK